MTLGLPPGHVITVLLRLRRLRANHKNTTRTALRFVLEHPGADALIAARPRPPGPLRQRFGTGYPARQVREWITSCADPRPTSPSAPKQLIPGDGPRAHPAADQRRCCL
ncbi:hypothetical protein [Actinomadura madurae]|uniref:hypothetical protein n=1 Tax=Actinomadura madurae TaxID=1993 RepID=UPI0020D21BE8|nr:hypothetical protein [Actinomadura madurae]MCQ0017777.1 hypothetical protein [Actinomadura madurae]